MPLKFFLTLSLLLIFCSLANSAFTNGMSSTLCNKSICNSTNNCQCPSLTNPGNFSLADTPQFVTFTWDDAIENSVFTNWFPSNFFWNGSIVDTLGCRPRPTFYVTSTATDYTFVNLFSKYGLVCDHSVTHTTNRSSSLSTFDYETKTSRDWIQGYSKMAYKINCARAPFLEFSDNYFQSLLDAQFQFESSVYVTAQGNNGSRWWPFTLDYGLPESDVCSDVQCPSKGFNIWEIPMQHMYTRVNGQITDVWTDLMDPNVTSSNYNATLSRFKYNFLENYQNSRVPMGIYIHYFWFQLNSNLWSFVQSNLDTTKVQFVNDYYKYMSTFQNVVFATEAMIVTWMKNPITYSQIVADKSSNSASIYKCPDYTITVNSTCPSNYPLTTCTNSTDGSTFLSCGCTQVNYTSICQPLSNCATQDANCKCTACNTGFSVSNGACVACNVASCSSYSSGCTCSGCSSGFSLSNGQCCASVSSCSTYNSTCGCATCSTGFSLSSSQCCATVSGCSGYSATCGCTGCSTGFTFSNSKCCSSVSQCSTYNSNCGCQTCASNYVLSGSQCCSAIPSCSTYNSTCGCSTCSSGFTLSSNQCCSTITGCSTYNSICQAATCSAGYSLSNGACTSCSVPNCSGYSSGCTCSSCSSGFTLSSTKQCCGSIPNCASQDASCNCLTCSAGFTLSGNSCVSCGVTSCSAYSSGCTCSACNSGFSLSAVNNKCCSSVSNCNAYDNTCACTSCASTFTLASSNKCCSNIASCTSYNPSTCNCVTCAQPYVLNSNTCSCPVVTNCNSYNTTSCSCLTCNTGFSLVNSACQACASISGCSAYKSDCTCNVCSTGLILSNNQCITCSISNCASLSSTNCSCNTCSSGYSLTNGQCTACSVTNCNSYSSNSCTCTGCSTGFSVSNGVCTQSSACSNVNNCYSLNTISCKCNVCNPGYTLINGACSNYLDLFPFYHGYDGFCGAKGSNPWLYSNCQDCFQAIASANCTQLYGSVSDIVYSDMYCQDYSTFCVRKGYCKPISSNIITSCSNCQSCYEGSTTCPSGYTCSRDTYCTDDVKKCSTNHP